MKLIINGTTDQIFNLVKQLNLGLAVLNTNDDSLNINLDADGNSCVQEKLEIPTVTLKPAPKQAKTRSPKFNHPPVVDPKLPIVGDDRTGAAPEMPKKEKSGFQDERICYCCGEKFMSTHPKSHTCPECKTMYGAAAYRHYNEAFMPPNSTKETPSEKPAEDGRSST